MTALALWARLDAKLSCSVCLHDRHGSVHGGRWIADPGPISRLLSFLDYAELAHFASSSPQLTAIQRVSPNSIFINAHYANPKP